MNVLLTLTALLAAPQPVDGTLLFLQHGNPVVEVVTRKEVTHVGIVFLEAEMPWLYEASPGKVRRVPLERFYAELSEYNRGRKKPALVQLRNPVAAYSAEQTRDMKSFLESQLDRRYSVKNYVLGSVGDGTHCAELTANTLNRGGVVEFERSQKISPGELDERLRELYRPGAFVALPAPQPRSWCERSQRWWGGFFTWCGWSCGEAWSFCKP